ncbi:MAG: three-Cys-motif partner protein TcmP [Terrimicrobiaceae bacterium]|jgi:three-Cys-motif partner protein|nr:three-Cys-motif partner protein TcmP [Terrimicrobiaceae bacterium]
MNSEFLFPDVPRVPVAQKVRTLDSAIWTRRKSLLIKLYLQLFVFVTNRGTYIDAFAGPQEKEDAWSARLVWTNDPGPKRKRLDRFELFELKKASASTLRRMVASVPANKRKVHVIQGDANIEVPKMLGQRPIGEPAFCLLDQRTTECSWDLVKILAEHKQEGHKIELFYFLMAGWKDRSLKNIKRDADVQMKRWWGRDDYSVALKASQDRLAEIFRERFMEELGYKYTFPYPIYSNPDGEGGGRLQYWMIHASDHEEAHKFMSRAYNKLASGYDPKTKQDEFAWSEAELASLKRRR